MSEINPEYQSALSSAIALLSSRGYSTYELTQKLQKKYSEEVTKQVIEFLHEKKYLDDHVYAENLVRYWNETSPKGWNALAQKLKQKGVPAHIIDSLKDEQEEDGEYEKALSAGQQKYHTFSDNLPETKKKEKLVRFLAGRGFSLGICFEVFEQIKTEEN